MKKHCAWDHRPVSRPTGTTIANRAADAAMAASAPTAWPRRWRRAISAATPRNIRQTPGSNWPAPQSGDVSRIRPARPLPALSQCSRDSRPSPPNPTTCSGACADGKATCSGWVIDTYRPLIAPLCYLWQQQNLGGMIGMRLVETMGAPLAGRIPDWDTAAAAMFADRSRGHRR